MFKYLELHKHLLKSGLCAKNSGYNGGLCAHLGEDEDFIELFSPNTYEGDEIVGSVAYWGYDGVSDPDGVLAGKPNPARYKYTPLRQNMVLFMAAMNNEL